MKNPPSADWEVPKPEFRINPPTADLEVTKFEGRRRMDTEGTEGAENKTSRKGAKAQKKASAYGGLGSTDFKPRRKEEHEGGEVES